MVGWLSLTQGLPVAGVVRAWVGVAGSVASAQTQTVLATIGGAVQGVWREGGRGGGEEGGVRGGGRRLSKRMLIGWHTYRRQTNGRID